ncbi:MAG: ATP-dependent helicase [Desulfobacterales bacterium]|nr:ATP-dependent helicase [Desulfobacterales bacterium]
MESKKYKIDYEKELNPAQLKAVTAKDGSFLIIAGAGSGKTRTLTYRVARLVEDGVISNSILLLTFTRKASFEMISRANKLLDNRCSGVAGGTFHSFANMLLRRYAPVMGLQSNFTILDRKDSEELVSHIVKELEFTGKKPSNKRTIPDVISKSINKNMPIEEIINDEYKQYSDSIEFFITVNDFYKKIKFDQKLLDYDDLLVYLKNLFQDYPEICKKVSSTYSYIMVDEYQDTNSIQADLVYFLASTHKNIMVVGDDSQSIYSFRGANFKNIIDFPKIFSDTTIITLEENYRSCQPILDLTNVLIEQAKDKYSKKLFTTKETGGNIPLLVKLYTEYDQSRYLVNNILKLNKDEKIQLDDIAVLFRASYLTFDLELELNKEKIPYIKVGGFKFMESSHLKDLLAYLKVMVNHYDSVSWNRILLLVRNVGQKSAKMIYNELVSQGSGYQGLFNMKFKRGYASGMKDLAELFKSVSKDGFSVGEIGNTVLQYYMPIFESKYDDYLKRVKDLEQFVIIMDRYKSLEEFVVDMALEPPNTVDEASMCDTHSNHSGKLILSTIHSAKGLEWHTAFVIWTLDGKFPSFYNIKHTDDFEEELRLMYVAATRAKENLIFTYPSNVYDRSTRMVLNCPSRFLEGLPKTVLKRFTVSNVY